MRAGDVILVTNLTWPYVSLCQDFHYTRTGFIKFNICFVKLILEGIQIDQKNDEEADQ